MRRKNILSTVILLFIFIISFINISFTIAGWDTDPIGDSDFAICDITRLDVDPDYMKITVDETIVMNESLSGFLGIGFAFHVWIETSQLDDTADLTWDTENYEYYAHINCKWISDTWQNYSFLQATRYYRESDGGPKTEGTFYWNIQTDSWQATDPEQNVATIEGKTITWDTEGAIYRDQPLGTGYVIQAISYSNYLGVNKDIGPNNHLVDEFDNMCVQPSSNTSSPTNPLPNAGFILSMVFLAIGISSITQIRKRRK